MTTALVKKSESDAVAAKVNPKPQAADDQSAPPVEETEAPDVDDLPGENETAEVYANCWRSIQPIYDALDLKLGWLAWLRGTILLRAKSSKKVKVSFKSFCKSLGLPESTGHFYKRIAEKYTADDVRSKTQTQLRDMLSGKTGQATGKATGKGKAPTINHKNIAGKLESVLRIVSKVKTMRRAGAGDDHASIYKTEKQRLGKIITACQAAIAEFEKRLAEPKKKKKAPTKKKKKAKKKVKAR